MFEFKDEIGIDLDHILPIGGGRVAMGLLYTSWAMVSVTFIGVGAFQDSTFLLATYVATGSLFLLALLLFIAINLMTGGKPGCVLTVLQNVVAMVLGLLAILTFFFGHGVEIIRRWITEGFVAV
jgi:hypothetical protein